MSHPFKVTALGLQVDKVMILPGSNLELSAPAPAHWSRFGEAGRDEAKELTVATPAAAKTSEPSLQEQAEALGIEVDGRWGDKRLQEEIDKAEV